MISILEFFSDSLLRAPMVGSILMGIGAALVGVFLYLRKESLLGEALSHGAYPGVVLSALVASFFFRTPGADEGAFALIGAFITALLGLKLIGWLKNRLKMHSDAALCLILSLFFGVGVLIASRLQVTHPLWYRSIHTYLYGQAATMVDKHIVLYAFLVSVTVLLILALFRPLQWIHFDRDFSKSVGARVTFVEAMIELLLILSIVIGMRSVGVVLLSGMLIAPAVAARPWTHRLSRLLFLAAFLGGLSGFLGNYLSVALPIFLEMPDLALPTGPMILLSAVTFSVLSLFFAPRSGVLSRYYRTLRFRKRCVLENVLKRLWREGEGRVFSQDELKQISSLSFIQNWALLGKMKRQGWLLKEGKGKFRLSLDGFHRGARIVRLHRLWEVYLVDYLGQHKDQVHRSAEQMEHILSPTLERELTKLLKNPKHDPHAQPIPKGHEPILGK